jgi:hypothetical protein
MMSSEPQLGQCRKGGMLDIGDEDGSHSLFYLAFTKRYYRHFKVPFQANEVRLIEKYSGARSQESEGFSLPAPT